MQPHQVMAIATRGNLGLDFFQGSSGGVITNPTFPNSGSSSSGINWGNIINSGFSIASQVIGAFGKNPTNQIVTNQGNNQPISNPSPYGSAGSNAANNAAAAAAAAAAANNNSAGNALGSGVDGILNWMSANPTYVMLGAAGLYLLFKQPPNSRR